MKITATGIEYFDIIIDFTTQVYKWQKLLKILSEGERLNKRVTPFSESNCP